MCPSARKRHANTEGFTVIGGCRYGDKYHRMNPSPWSNTISTVTKDNLLCEEYT